MDTVPLYLKKGFKTRDNINKQEGVKGATPAQRLRPARKGIAGD